jgi:DNA-binding NtrC family response regulator/pSer/pThr/pTyr-binding forkhead associated (FHA) protein
VSGSVITSGEVSDWDGGPTRQTSIDTSASREPRLSLVVHHDAGMLVVPLAKAGAITIGRTEAADIVVADDSLSRRHARLLWADEGVWLEDLGSTNGTYVGGARVSRVLIAPGDEIALGSVVAALHLVDPSRPVQPIVPEEAFEEWLREALVRSRAQERPLALLMVRELGQRQGHLGRWLPRVRGQLRGHEAVGLYGPGWLVIGAEGVDYEAAERLAQAITAPRDGGPALGCAVASAPHAAAAFDELLGVVRELSDIASEAQPVRSARDERPADIAASLTQAPVIESPVMRELYETVRRVASSNAFVLICGETGVGKELVARAIHAGSPRVGKPLLTINCGALPATLAESVLFGHERGSFTGADRRRVGAFEQASGGTVFLDEIAELPQSAQAALLRAIDTQRIMRVGSTHEIRVDVRLLAASNRDLDQLAADGAFRPDLLFRLNTVTLQVPPLRERVEEIEPLAEHFLALAQRAGSARGLTFDHSALRKLRGYAWPGNVRELRNAVERAVILAAGPTINADDMRLQSEVQVRRATPTLRIAPPVDGKLKDRVRAYEAELIIDALKQHGWNQTETARALNMPVRTLAHKIQLYGLKERFHEDG